MKLNIIDRINKAKLKKIECFSTSYLISRINDDIGKIQTFFADNLISAIKDIFLIVVCCFTITYFSIRLSIIIFLSVPFYIVSLKFFSQRINNASGLFAEANSQYVKQLGEVLNTIKITKINSKYELVKNQIDEKLLSVFKTNLKLFSLSNANSYLYAIMHSFIPMLVISYGGYEVIQERFSIGSLIAINTFVILLFSSITRLLTLNISIQNGLVSLDRIKEIEKLTIPEKINKKSENISISSFQLKNISFSFDKKNIFNELNLSINKGDKIGVVGDSGIGKTTLLNLIAGFYSPERGELYVNGEPKSFDFLASNRQLFSYVDQEHILHDVSVIETMRFGNENATVKEITQALNKAHLNNTISRFSNGLNSSIGPSGNSLSVGEKQRLSIARAFIKNSQFFLMDEITSSIDPDSKKIILDTIKKLPNDKIVIIVSHDYDSITFCNKIYKLHKGKLNEIINKKRRILCGN